MNAAVRRKPARRTARATPSASTPRTSAAAVRDATGRTRDEWFALLDAWGADARTHRDTAAWIMREHGVANWWAQTLTVDYEHARGLRPQGGRRDGTFTVNASKTVDVPVERLFEAFVNARQRKRWLPDVVLRQRTALAGRTAHFDCDDGATRLHVFFAAKGAAKSQVAVLHERVASARAAKELKAFWREGLLGLKRTLEGVAR